MAADLGPIFGGAFYIDAAILNIIAEGGNRQALLHDIEFCCVVAMQGCDGQADAVDSDTGTNLQVFAKTIRKFELIRAQAGLVIECCDAGDALYYACKHD